MISAFRAPDGSLIVVGVKEGGANRIDVTLPLSESIPPVWDLYQTTRELSCVKTGTLKVKGGHAEIDLPDEAVFTLVGPVK